MPVAKPGIIEGVVIGNLLPNNLVQVRLQGIERPVNCVWAAAIISGLLGFKTSFIPPISTKVLVYYTGQDTSFIVGSVPSALTDPVGQKRAITDPDVPDYQDSEVFNARKKSGVSMLASHKPPLDLAEGELLIDNLMGVGIALLRNMAALSAGDLARVETHLMNDMVRIISGMFRHHSAFGDHKIYNDGGRLNVEFNGTLYDHESYGTLNPEQPRTKMLSPDVPDLGSDSQIDGYTDEGRWRFSQYVGWLGDFINVWVSDPVQALGRLASDQLRGGKFRFHTNADGSCLVQSVAEICLEKVVRIPVPVRIRREDDPAGNRSDSDLRGLQHLTNWRPTGSLFEMAFQLREYARWLSNTWSLARFRQMDLDFRVPTEAESPAPNPNSFQPDKHGQNKDNQDREVSSWREVYACIRILRDGSTVIVDGYGNSIMTTAVGVQISSASNLYLEAAGSVNIVAGRDINLLAQKNVGITAVKEAVRIKSEAALQMLSKVGKVIMDFVTPGWLVLKNGSLNVNGNASIDGQLGNADFNMTVTATQMTATLTDIVSLGEHTHNQHLFIGAPSPQPLDAADEFKFQTDYAPGTLYQTFTQRGLETGEQVASSSWDFAGNEVSGKGSPWPGPSPQHQKAAGGSDLKTPATDVQNNQPTAMTSAAINLKTQ